MTYTDDTFEAKQKAIQAHYDFLETAERALFFIDRLMHPQDIDTEGNLKQSKEFFNSTIAAAKMGKSAILAYERLQKKQITV